MYKWVVYFLKEWKVSCEHVYTFNMDEWADAEGNTLASDNPGAFQYAMEQALFNPLGELTVPKNQRNFATKENLPTYSEKIAALKADGAKLVLVYGIGRMCHIAFWEPTFAADYAIGGADGTLGRGMQWQGMSLWMTLRYGKTPWITSSYIPTIPGRLFFLRELAGPLVAECN